MRRTSYRQYRAWMRYLREMLNEPSRTDYYLMQVAAETRRGNVKPGTRVQVKDMKIEFNIEPKPAATRPTRPAPTHGPDTPSSSQEESSGEPSLTARQATINSKMVWAARLAAAGVKPIEGKARG